ncbi:MAG: cytochrome d ubiquinol oxidase subunit II [Nostocoides sp.]
MTLITIWFILLAVLWTGYLVLEGFDFGVGSLLPVLGGSDYSDSPKGIDQEKRRRVMLTSIGPFWDGNEVWLLTAGGATFAAFPVWYSTMFSGMYLALLVILVALIVRNMGFDYRHKRNSVTWHKRWDLAITIGSILPPFLLGVALTNLVHGLPMNAEYDYTGSFFSLLNPVSLLGGLTVLALSLVHGAHYLALKTAGQISQDAKSLATRLGLVAAVLAVILLLWLGLTANSSIWSWITTVLAAVSLLAGMWFNLQGRAGWAFIGTSVTMAMAVVTYFLMLWPNAIVGSEGTNLSLEAAASTPLTLKIMTGAALVFTPIALIYTAWNYWVFRKRLTVEQIPEAVSVS